MQIEIINQSHHLLPAYATEGASGLDIRAYIQENITLLPLQRVLVNTGLYVALPAGLEAQIRPRSGLALKQGITVLNTPGTIDSDYRGEIKVLLINLSEQPFTIQDGERIAQLVIAPYTKISWSSVSTLSTTDRGAGGYGSTGIQ
jgi:dUTP pyrophosphatase